MNDAARLAAVSALVLSAMVIAWTNPAATEPSRRKAPQGHRGITDELDCSACHTPAGWKTLTDGPTGRGFDHDRTGFPLRGQHSRAGCTECHQADQKITRECSGCHEDFHRGRLSTDCSECHNSTTWQRTDAIERHRMTRLPLSGMHALVACTDCHRRASDRQWSSVQAQCFACHADDYRRRDIHPLHVGSATSAPFDRNCALCHRATGWSPAIIPIGAFTQTAAALSLNHDAHFPIRFGSHRRAQCNDCHVREDGTGPIRCTGCHEHGPIQLRRQHQSRMPPSAGRACLDCHPGGSVR